MQRDVIFAGCPARDGARFHMIQIADNHVSPALLPSPRPHAEPPGTGPGHAAAHAPATAGGPAGPRPRHTVPRPPATGRRSRVHATPRRLRATGLMATLTLATVAAPGAETLFVTDRIDVGLHRSPDLDSAIVAEVPSDTALEVIEREGALIHVKTPGGASGWVAATYVTAERPARTVLSEMERRAGDQARQLARARETIGDLERRLAESRERHRAARDTITALEAGVGAQESRAAGAGREEMQPGAPAPGGAGQEMQRLAEENRRMHRTVAELKAELEARRRTPREPADARPPAAPAPPAAGTPRDPSPTRLLEGPPPVWRPWHWMLAGFTALLLLSTGGYIVDWRFRRRHGGFRL